jgi:hypothetical protein
LPGISFLEEIKGKDKNEVEVFHNYLTLGYGLDFRNNQYFQETLFGKKEEWLYGHVARIVGSFNQKWGSTNGTIEYNNYFHDWSLNSLNINLYANVRLSGALSFYMGMWGGLTRNQVFIPKGGASVEDVLTRRRQLASGYYLGSWFGISYRFGSMLNNFVNPRFSDDF